ncbi:MAG: glycosyltransferase family A protein [Cyanobacteria bacterium J06592_8]
MNTSFDVSVIIPTYNRISMLEEALQSVFSQEFDGTVEVIVIDDNSSDKTSEIVSDKYPEVNLISLTKNIGPSAARNRALSLEKGKYIAFLDSDDLWEKNYLNVQISSLKGELKCFSVSNLILWNTQKNSRRVRVQNPDLKKYTSMLHHFLVGTFIYTPSSVVFPRQVLEDVGFFNEESRFCDDTNFYIRCLLAGYQPKLTKYPLTIQRKHSEGQITDHKNLRKRLKARLSHVEKFYPLVHKKSNIPSIRKIYAEVYIDFARQYLARKSLINWLKMIWKSAFYSSNYALSSLIADLIKIKRKQESSID